MTITVSYAAAKALAEALGDKMPECVLWINQLSEITEWELPALNTKSPTFSELVLDVLPKLREKITMEPCYHCEKPVIRMSGGCFGALHEEYPNHWLEEQRGQLFGQLVAGGMEAVSAAVIELCREAKQ